MKISDQCILVLGPPWGDALFYGEWLLAAAKAESFWKDALKDPDFEQQVEQMCVCYIPDFGIAAAVMIMQLREHRTSFLVNMNSEHADHFVMMAGMGFFSEYEQFYRMTQPPEITSEKVRRATLNYARTEDEQFELHPEYLVTTMPYSHARTVQFRLDAIDEFNAWVNCQGRA